MSASTYDAAIARVLAHEGGYANNKSDPGGPTNFGITLATYRHFLKPDATAADVQKMTLAEAKGVYRAHFAAPEHYDELPAGVDYAVLDYAVNSGPARAFKVLQHLVGVPQDGEIGPATVKATAARDPRALIGAICDERLTFLKSLKTWPTFGKGWSTRVSEVRTAALAMAGSSASFKPDVGAEPVTGVPPWLARMNAILGLYEFPGGADNPCILAMAKACGGAIARTYKHDVMAWCSLTVNWAVTTSGLKGTDSLLALSWRKAGTHLAGPAVGAIATKTRGAAGSGLGHVFLVIGRTSNGMIVGRGGNQADMVCDEVFEPAILQFNWPAGYPLPKATGMAALPIVKPAPRTHKAFSELPPVTAPTVEAPAAKGIVAPPDRKTVATGGGAVAAAGGGLSHWMGAHPWETGLVLAGGLLAVAAVGFVIERILAHEQVTPADGAVPVTA